MELIELSWGWISIHSQVIRWGGLSIGLGRAQFINGLHLLISDAIFILTHPPTHVHKCTLAHKGCPSYLFKDPSWAFALIWFVCFLSLGFLCILWDAPSYESFWEAQRACSLTLSSFPRLSNTDTQSTLSEKTNILITFKMLDFALSLLIHSVAMCNWLSH